MKLPTEIDDCTLLGRCTKTSRAALQRRQRRRLRRRHRAPRPAAERLLRGREHRVGRNVADHDEERVVRTVVGLVILDDRGAIDGRQRLGRDAGARVRVLAEQRLPEQLVGHELRRRRLRLQLLRGVGLHQVDLGLRERRIAHDVGQHRQHLRQRLGQAAHLERGGVLAGGAATRLAPIANTSRLSCSLDRVVGAFLRRLGDELRQARLVGRIDREARLDRSGCADTFGTRAVAHGDDAQAVRQRALDARRRRERTARARHPASAAPAPAAARSVDASERDAQRPPPSSRRSDAADHRAPPCAGFGAGRLSIDVRLAGTSHCAAAAFTSSTVTLSSSLEDRVDAPRIVVEQREDAEQVGAAEARHAAALQLVEERRAHRGLRLLRAPPAEMPFSRTSASTRFNRGQSPGRRSCR